jgi:hypothetical protein
MGSRKRSARAKERAAFESSLGGMDDAFARAERREEGLAARREEGLRVKACESKNRYDTYEEAQEALAWCAEQGRRGLHIYRCPYCDGWHLTHKQQKDD